MIGKGKAIAHTRASMMYGWKQEKEAEVIFRQLLAGDNPSEITAEFQLTQELNYNCTKNTLSFVLSPTIEDGKKLSFKDLNQICTNFMKEMELKERQAIGFVHRNREHVHIHLYVNRIDFKGVAYKDSFIGKRSQAAAEKVAERMNLTTIRQLRMEKEINLKDIRSEIKRRHDIVMKHMQPKSFSDYIEAMARNKVKVIPTINNANKLQGFRFEFDGYNLKGSEIHRSMSAGNIGKEIADKVGLKNFISKNLKVTLLDKVVGLSGNLALRITRHAIKKIITRGIGY